MKKSVRTHKVKHEKINNIIPKKSGFIGKIVSVILHSATIRVKLILSFLVPIAFIVLLGIVSFLKASEGMQSSYKKSTQQVINMTGEYVQMGVNSIEAASQQYMNDGIKQKYFLGEYKSNDALRDSNFKIIKNDINAKQQSDEFISNISFLSDTVQAASTLTYLKGDICSGFFSTETGKLVANSKPKLWIGKNDFLDENMKVGSDKYAMRFLRKFVGSDSLIVIDMDMNRIKEILQNMQFDKTGFLAVVTPDGKEIVPEDSTQMKSAIFSDKDFYSKAVKSDKKSGASDVKYKGKDHLFMYSKIGDTGAMICAIIPESTILGQADSIKKITVFIVIIACIVAVLIGFSISYGIDRTIRNIIVKLKKAAAGDLTVDFSTKRKDEFRILIDEINHTFTNMKELVSQVKDLSTGVSDASSDISQTSEAFLRTSEDISSAMNEIEQGMNQQAKDAEECLLQMDNLSNKIEHMSSSTAEIGKIANDTRKNIQEGTIVTEELTVQTKHTISIATDIVKGIEELSEKSMSIGSIVNVINEISNQTNLLSLNASIEAARAGEVGKGFAVVANEIRSLADQTRHSVNDIKNIIERIQENTKDVVKTAKDAENVMVLQDNAVKNTAKSYQGINESVDRLMDNLKVIIEDVNNIEGARASTLAAIENISAVLEEIAASTNNVNQISNNQLKSVETLNQSAGNLNSNSDVLVTAIQKFKV